MATPKTDAEILKIARDILATEGLGGVSFDAIARRLGRSKQAVLYWYPTKQALLAAMYLPWLEAETEAGLEALRSTPEGRAAIAGFVRAIAAFHFRDLDRFRAMYLMPQTLKRTGQDATAAGFVAQVHPVTDRLYSALADHCGGDRQQAVAIHSAVLGMVMLFGLADSLDDPLKHSQDEMTEALISRLTGAK